MRKGCQQGVDNPQFVRLDRSAGLGDIDDGIDEIGDFHFSGTPGEFDLGFDALGIEIALGDAHAFGGDALAFEVLGLLDRRVLGDNQYPAGWSGAGA